MVVRDGIVNFYILRTSDGLVCFDTGWRTHCVLRGFTALGLNIHSVNAVFLTHMHWDHTGALQLFPNAEVFVGEHEVSRRCLQRLTRANVKPVKGGQILAVGDTSIRAVDTPGHTPGSVSYLADKGLLFTGDTLRVKTGRILPFPFWFNRDNKTLARSIRLLASMNGIECVLTAHHGITKDIGHAFSRWHDPMPTHLKGGATP